MAHMWMGNLVTMEWWDQIWLNEGVADYLDYYANEAVPSMKGTAETFLLTLAAETAMNNGQSRAINPGTGVSFFLRIVLEKVKSG